jgi:hypothetical protein
MGMFSALSVFGRRNKEMIQLRPEQVWTYNVTRHHRPLLSPSGSRNWEPHGVTLTGYRYAIRHEKKVQIVTPFRVSHLQCENTG